MNASRSNKVNRRWLRAYSLVEVMMVAAVLSTVTAVGTFTITNVSEATRSTKLQRDVVIINRAISSYLANGGTFTVADLRNPHTLLNKLKRRADGVSTKRVAGLHGTMLDQRLSYRLQTETEAGGGAERAELNSSDPQHPHFVVKTDGEAGIQEFILDNSLAGTDFGEERRTSKLNLSELDDKRWVWNFNESAPSRDLPQTRQSTSSEPLPVTAPDPGNSKLRPPTFSAPGQVYPLSSYPMTVGIIDPNAAGAGELEFSNNSGPFARYTSALTFDPGMTVVGYVRSLNIDLFDDSDAVEQSYTTQPENTVAAMTFAKTAYNYFELGGQPAPGSPSPATQGITGTGSVQDLGGIPAVYQDSDNFVFQWTLDGSNPLTSPTAQQQPPFSDGYVPAPIPVTLANFGTGTSLDVRGAIKAMNTNFIVDSPVAVSTLVPATINLRAPDVTFNGRDVTLALDVSGGNIPADTRIYYTVDGSDPGDNDGEPVSPAARLYTGAPFYLSQATGASVTVSARTYPPAAWKPWFITSDSASQATTVPPAAEVYVGGNFFNPSGNPLRNIARLRGDGGLDLRFDTGAGASVDSLVGVIRESGGGIVAGGDFESVNGAARPGVVRLSPDGAVDNTFNAGLTAQ